MSSNTTYTYNGFQLFKHSEKEYYVYYSNTNTWSLSNGNPLTSPSNVINITNSIPLGYANGTYIFPGKLQISNSTTEEINGEFKFNGQYVDEIYPCYSNGTYVLKYNTSSLYWGLYNSSNELLSTAPQSGATGLIGQWLSMVVEAIIDFNADVIMTGDTSETDSNGEYYQL